MRPICPRYLIEGAERAHTGRSRARARCNTIRVYRPRSRLTNARASGTSSLTQSSADGALQHYRLLTLGPDVRIISLKMTRLDRLSKFYLAVALN